MARIPKQNDEDEEWEFPDNTGPDANPGERGTILRHVQLLKVLEKIPLFQGLTPHQFKQVLHVCERRCFSANETLFRAGEESHGMFILLQGSLKVLLPDGKEISRIDPIGIVGEMGVFTGERRSASIVAITSCIMLSLHKMELLRLFRHDADLGIRVLLNVILDLSRKLRRDNEIIKDLKPLCSPGKSTEIIRRKRSG